MELTNTRTVKAELVKSVEQSWAPAIRARFGTVQQFTARFLPRHDVQRHCSLNVEKAVRMGDSMPTLARAMAVYGLNSITCILQGHLALALVSMGDEGKMDTADVAFCAQAIADAPKLRVLKFPTVLAFFHSLKCGEYKIYGQMTTRKLMEAFNLYAERALDREHAERQRMEEESKRAEAEQERAAAQKWDVTRRKLGLPEGTTYLDWVLQGLDDERKAAEAAKRKKEAEERRELERAFLNEAAAEYRELKHGKSESDSQVACPRPGEDSKNPQEVLNP